MTPSEAIQNHPVKFISYILVLVGALNWGSIGLDKGDFVGKLVGANSKYVFILVGLAGLYLAAHEVYWIYESNKQK